VFLSDSDAQVVLWRFSRARGVAASLRGTGAGSVNKRCSTLRSGVKHCIRASAGKWRYSRRRAFASDPPSRTDEERPVPLASNSPPALQYYTTMPVARTRPLAAAGDIVVTATPARHDETTEKSRLPR